MGVDIYLNKTGLKCVNTGIEIAFNTSIGSTRSILSAPLEQFVEVVASDSKTPSIISRICNIIHKLIFLLS